MGRRLPGVACAVAATPGRAWLSIECCWPSWARPGTRPAVLTPTSSSAAINCRASNWLGPLPGTRVGMPTPDTAAFASTSTHAVNCAHATHTSTASVLTNVSEVIGCWSTSELKWCGNGDPMYISSAAGTATTSTASARNAPNARTMSPNVRCLRGGWAAPRPAAGGYVPWRSCVPWLLPLPSVVRVLVVRFACRCQLPGPVIDTASALPSTVIELL